MASINFNEEVKQVVYSEASMREITQALSGWQKSVPQFSHYSVSETKWAKKRNLNNNMILLSLSLMRLP